MMKNRKKRSRDLIRCPKDNRSDREATKEQFYSAGNKIFKMIKAVDTQDHLSKNCSSIQ